MMLELQNYRSQLVEAVKQTNELFEGSYHEKFETRGSGREISKDEVTRLIFDYFRRRGEKLTFAYLANQCFKVAALASEALSKAQVQHVLTIGDIRMRAKVANVWGYSTTIETLRSDINEGYKDGVAPVHAWITLESGQVLDLAIIASDEVSFYERPPQEPLDGPDDLRQALYLSQLSDGNPYEHKPILVGFGYHFRVLTDSVADPFYQAYCAAFREYKVACGHN